MRAKNYLLKYRRICKQIEMIESEIDELIAAIPAGHELDGMPRGSDLGDVTGNLAARVTDLKLKSSALLALKLQEKHEIIDTLMKLKNPDHMALLMNRYIMLTDNELTAWNEVAKRLFVSENYARGRLHSAALIELERILNDGKTDR